MSQTLAPGLGFSMSEQLQLDLDTPAPKLADAADKALTPSGDYKRSLMIGATSMSIAAHLLVAVLVLTLWISPRPEFEPKVVMVDLAPPFAPTLTPAPTPSAAAAKQETPPPPNSARPNPLRAPISPLRASEHPTMSPDPGLTDAQLAGAATAGDGPSGRPCDMVRRLQSALRTDPLVRTAGVGLSGKAVMVWNGDWVQSSGEDGKGLAAIREAILWEVGFAPEACRAEPVHGLVVLSLGPAAGGARLALGAGEWRWSDLLGLHAVSGLR